MHSLKERLRQLENDLVAVPIRISNETKIPFAIFQYDPTEEFEMQRRLANFKISLEKNYLKKVQIVSLAAIMFKLIEEAAGLEFFWKAEEQHGLDRANDTIYKILTEVKPLENEILDVISLLDPDESVIFLTRAGALFPAFRTSALLEGIRGKVEIPTILFYPGHREGPVGLKFMGIYEADHNYRVKIY